VRRIVYTGKHRVVIASVYSFSFYEKKRLKSETKRMDELGMRLNVGQYLRVVE